MGTDNETIISPVSFYDTNTGKKICEMDLTEASIDIDHDDEPRERFFSNPTELTFTVGLPQIKAHRLNNLLHIFKTKKLSRDRFIKLLMGAGIDRNNANYMALTIKWCGFSYVFGLMLALQQGIFDDSICPNVWDIIRSVDGFVWSY